MRRRIVTIFSSVSLSLCAVLCVLWERSYHLQPPPAAYADRWVYSHGYVATDRGQFEIIYYDSDHGMSRPFICRDDQWHGFSISEWQGGSGWNGDWQYTSVALPIAAAAVPLGLLGTLWLVRRPNSFRRRSGLCSHCGYDLRATPDRCPECGTVAGRWIIPRGTCS